MSIYIMYNTYIMNLSIYIHYIYNGETSDAAYVIDDAIWN